MPRSEKRKPKFRNRPASRRPRQKSRGPRRTGSNTAADPTAVRLQKVLAAAGCGSRRQCEQMILEGRVDVDGKTVTELGMRVDPAVQKIRFDGQLVKPPKRNLYFLVYKPIGILSTNFDPSGRPRVIDLTPSHQRLFTVGRLDKSSEGLILVTNDGRLTDLLTHPRYGVEKTYLAEVAGVPQPAALAKLEQGVHLAEGFAHAKRVFMRRKLKQSAVLEIVLDEGRNREVRRLLARIGHKVLKLRRVAIGKLKLGNLKAGESRPLRPDEIEELYQTALNRRKQKPARPRGEDRGEGAAVEKIQPSPIDNASAIPRFTHESVHPIIDKSLPAGAFDDENFSALNLPAANDAAEYDDDEEFIGQTVPNVGGDDDDDFAAFDNLEASDDDFADDPANRRRGKEKIETAPVDLRPFRSGKRQPKRGAVIGGDSRQGKQNKQHGDRRGNKTPQNLDPARGKKQHGRAGQRKGRKR